MIRIQHRRPLRGVLPVALAVVVAVASDRAEAQVAPGVYTNFGGGAYQGIGSVTFGNFGYPYGGYGGLGYTGYMAGRVGYGGYLGGYGYGGYGGYGYPRVFGGLTPIGAVMRRNQRAALNASRYNLMNAKAETSYQAANLFRTQAVGETIDNYRKANGESRDPRRYDYDSRSPGPGSGQETGGSNPRPIPIDALFAKDGTVLWPLGAPEEGDLAAKKAAAGKAIGDLARASLNGETVKASQGIAARNALSDYAVPAADWFEENSKKDVPGFVNFIRSLDRAVRSLALSGRMEGTPAEEIGGIDVEPEFAPETAGDVLLKEIRDRDARAAGSGNP